MNNPIIDYPRRRHMQVLEQILPISGRRILDIGCGDGALVRRLSKRGAQLVGLEVSAARVAQAQACAAVGEERYVEGLGQQLPFEDGQFDSVIFFNSLHHVPAPFMQAALAQAQRVTRPGGHVCITEPISAGAFFEAFKSLDDETEVQAAAQQCIAQALANGLTEVSSQRYLAAYVYESFESCLAQAVAIDPSRAKGAAAQRSQLEQAFHQGAEKTADGYQFWMPAHVRLLRTPSL